MTTYDNVWGNIKIYKNPVFLISGAVFLLWVVWNLLQYTFYQIFYSFLNADFQITIFFLLAGISFASLGFSIIFLLSFKEYRYLVILPLLLNLITIGMNFNWPSNQASQFYSIVKIDLPKSATNIHDFSDPPSFNGDGTREFSFFASKEYIDHILAQRPFRNQNWKKGKIRNDSDECYYFQDHGFVCDGTLNKFWGPDNNLKFKDSDGLMSAINDRSPDPSFIAMSNYDKIIVDPNNLWVLVIVYDS